ncbi:MAG: alpha-xenorhabdolysin family binary toxin subunit A [Prochloron sp. SP5CPC1]|nr:alpha-xenorhabdolysin family binary toxin subunit A [Candidatus Paraprochloron terpiosi SP5CPC1]
MKGCSDDVTKKDQLCEDLDLDSKIQDLKDQRDDLKKEIEALNKDYDKNVGLAFTGAFGGIIGLAITGGIFGSKAEKIRKEINAKKAKLDEINDKIKVEEKLLEAITSLDNEFTNLFTVMNQAEKGLNQLVTTWTTIKEYLQQSHDAIEKIQEAEDLLLYSLDLIGMVNPWKEVKNNAAIITQQINDALDKWAQSQQ